MRSIILALAALQAILAISAKAQSPPAGQEQADIAHIETYLNAIATAQADFTMVSANGQTTRGVFDLSRPGKLRFEWSEPKGNLLIADGDYIIYWDAEQKEASNEPIAATPASFLLKPHISLGDGLRVTGYEHAAGMIRVTLTEAKEPGLGSVTVAFTEQPFELRAWRLNDPQGATDVTFSNWRLGVSLDPSLFHFQAPNAGKRHR